MISLFGNLAREFGEFERLFSPEHKNRRQLVFYAESAIYYLYFQDYIEHILNNSDLEITYISSDPNDKIFHSAPSRLHAFYIKNLLALTFSRLDARVLVMTVPDLNSGIVKRAPEPVHHIYAFHGISSTTHQNYRPHAFDNYDSLLCVGQYQIDEIRKAESIYALKPKHLLLTGYPLAERLYREHNQYRLDQKANAARRPLCLIAPSWWRASGPCSLMETSIDEMIEVLSDSSYDVWLRPHPEYLKRNAKRVKVIEQAIGKTKNISMQTELGSLDCLHRADVLVTDYSGIAMEYVIGTERPVLFIDTAIHITNPEAARIGLEPIENIFRSKMGLQLAPGKVHDILNALDSLLARHNEFRITVPEMREAIVANWQRASQVGSDYILGKCLTGIIVE